MLASEDEALLGAYVSVATAAPGAAGTAAAAAAAELRRHEAAVVRLLLWRRQQQQPLRRGGTPEASSSSRSSSKGAGAAEPGRASMPLGELQDLLPLPQAVAALSSGSPVPIYAWYVRGFLVPWRLGLD